MAEAADPGRSVFLITSSLEENHTHGTGFVIRQEGHTIWLLTCRHVVRDAGGPDAVRVDRLPVSRVFMKSEGPEDLAVLEIQGMNPAPALRLGTGGAAGSPIKTVGFYLFERKNDLKQRDAVYSIQPVEGELGNPGGHEVKEVAGRVNTWHLEMRGSDHLKEGYSGSPVIGTSTGAVIGVVSHMLGEGKTGVAISMDALLAVWPEMAPRLLRGDPEAGGQPVKDTGQQDKGDEANYGKLLALLCDRNEHDDTFQGQFIRFCTDADCQNAPQFYIIHGRSGEAHRSLVQRFVKTYIWSYAAEESRPDPDQDAVGCLEPDWIVRSDPETQKTTLLRQLFNAASRTFTGADYSIDNLLSLPQIEKYRVIWVHHYISCEKWADHCRDVLKWYMTKYWCPARMSRDAPLFIIFISIEYPKAEAGKSWLPFFGKRRNPVETFRDQLAQLAAEAGKACRCAVIDELGPVTRGQVTDWFRKWTSYNDYQIDQKVDEIFKGEETLPMSVIEDRLQPILSEIDQKAFQRYLEERPI